MERYCIVKKEISNSKSRFHSGIRIWPFIIGDCNYESSKDTKKDNLPKKKTLLFPECEAEIQRLLCCEIDEDFAESEEVMYHDILGQSFLSELAELDVYLHIYYSLLYEQNKERYISLTEADWIPDKKNILREKRKECNKYIRKHPEKVRPFEIKEKKNIQKNPNGKESYGETEIQEFAPNISRLYFLSSEFRQIFTEIERMNAEKYSYSRMRFLFKSDFVAVNRIEEIWLGEYLLGINLAAMFYSFFNPILKDISLKGIRTEYHEIMRNIIREVMKLEGIYTRCLMVQKLKVIYEMGLNSNLNRRHLSCKERLYYLYNQIRVSMPEYAEHINWLKKSVLNLRNDYKKEIDFIKDIKKICESMIEKNLIYSEGYYLMKGLPRDVDNGDLYMIVQKIILSERKEWVSSS